MATAACYRAPQRSDSYVKLQRIFENKSVWASVNFSILKGLGACKTWWKIGSMPRSDNSHACLWLELDLCTHTLTQTHTCAHTHTHAHTHSHTHTNTRVFICKCMWIFLQKQVQDNRWCLHIFSCYWYPAELPWYALLQALLLLTASVVVE